MNEVIGAIIVSEGGFDDGDGETHVGLGEILVGTGTVAIFATE
jgi:hypothetical protein